MMARARMVTQIAVLLALLAGVAHGQIPDEWAGRVPAAVREEIEQLVNQARHEGLPVEPLILKALEGSAKGVDPARIASAVRIYRAELRDARYLLESSDEAMIEPAAVTAVALALHRGLPPHEITVLLRATTEADLEPALHVACEIVARGYAPTDATELVAHALANAVTAGGLRELPRAVAVELQRGATRGEAMARVRVQLRAPPPGREP